MKCCGSIVKSPFCPQCGKRLRSGHALDGLLVQLRRTEKAHRKTVEQFASGETGPNHWTPERLAKRIAQLTAVVEKWKTWGDALEKLIEPTRPT